ncbi:MAG: dimethyl sulfoxide reductase anchor subunit [Gammaproteobacteria bacterium]|nr:dimethyl sulfoxide reductase anchor subunit [Gammaproteobacteria bacterium]
MHPAFSVIFLTTLIGAGQGLFLALYVSEISGLVTPPAKSFYVFGSLLSLALLVGGLIASFFHLGRPERAWRSAAMWKTSWLSREVIALPLTMLLIFIYSLAHYFDYTKVNDSNLSLIIGGIGVLSVLALFICTGMIYACIKFLQEWASPWTVINYTLFGCASGFTLATVHAAQYAPQAIRVLGMTAIFLTLIALITRVLSLLRNANIKPRANMQSAIGVRHSKISQQTVGFMGGSFNTREFFHLASPTIFKSIKWLFLILVFPVTIILLLAGLSTNIHGLLIAAFVVQYLGLIAERWFFFAQANHPQNLYYQVMS